MSRDAYAARGRFRREPLLGVEGLEGRQLPSAFAGSSASQQFSRQEALVRHDVHQYVGDLRDIEMNSQATPAEYLALRDDARSISSAASANSTVDLKTAQSKAVVASIELDRSLLYGSLGDSGWSVVQARFTSNLDGLGVPQVLIDRTIADMRAAAGSAAVSSSLFTTFTDDFNRLERAEDTLRSYNTSTFPNHFPEPGLYYTQHVRGFFRGWAVQKTTDETKLKADLRALSQPSPSDPAGVAALRRDASLLESLASVLPSDAGGRLLDAESSAFVQGPPTPQTVAGVQAEMLSLLGPSLTPGRSASVSQLANDLPAFFRAVGSSPSGVRTIVEDVRAVVNDGGDSSLNPFRVTIVDARGRPPG